MKKFLTLAVATFLLSSTVTAQNAEWRVLHNDIPDEAQRYTISLSMQETTGNHRNYHNGPYEFQSQHTRESSGGYDFDQKVALLSGEEVGEYFFRTSRNPNINFIGRNHNDAIYGEFVHVHDGKEEVILAGLMSRHGAVAVPITVPGSYVGRDDFAEVEVDLFLNIHGTSGSHYTGRWGLDYPGGYVGSHLLDDSKISVRISELQRLKDNNATVNISVDHYDDRLPDESASGKLTEIIEMKRGKAVVSRIAKDLSKMEIAVLHGDITEAAENELALGDELAPFTRLDFFRRELVSLDDLLERAGDDGWVLIVFGEEPITTAHYSPHNSTNLPMSPETLLKTVGGSTESTPLGKMLQGATSKNVEGHVVLAVISESINLKTVFETYINEVPNYYQFSNSANPMQSQFIGNSHHGGYFHHNQHGRDTLRGQLGVPSNQPALLLLNGKGQLVDLDLDAQSDFSATLSRFRQVISE